MAAACCCTMREAAARLVNLSKIIVKGHEYSVAKRLDARVSNDERRISTSLLSVYKAQMLIHQNHGPPRQQ